MSKRKPGRPRTGPSKRSVSFYVSEDDIKLVRTMLPLGDDQKAYIQSWLDRGAKLPEKKGN